MTVQTRRWLARASFALMAAAVAILLGFAGWHSLTLIAFAAIRACAVVAGAYWFLANRGVVRWLALILVIAAPVVILVTFARAGQLWVAVPAALSAGAAAAWGPAVRGLAVVARPVSRRGR